MCLPCQAFIRQPHARMKDRIGDFTALPVAIPVTPENRFLPEMTYDGTRKRNVAARRFSAGAKGLIAFLAFLSAFVPLSIDLYLPAMPRMVDFFSTTPELTNFTLSLFMLFFAISMLLWGPFTDKYGRKPVLYLGLVLYIAGSLVCVFATNIYLLIAGRVIQAIGSGAIQAVSMAIVKDNFRGLVMEKVLVWIQTLTILCPMLAQSSAPSC